MPAKRAAAPAKRPSAGSKPKSRPARAATPAPTARARPHETAKAPVKKAKTSYKPKTAGPTSTESERLKTVHARLDEAVHRLFPKVEPVFDYGMHGWRMPRLRKVEWTRGTVDPNYIMVGIAERKAGITLHFWNPIEWGMLKANEPALREAGFKVMVGCLNYTRKGDYPVEAVERLLERAADQVKAEA